MIKYIIVLFIFLQFILPAGEKVEFIQDASIIKAKKTINLKIALAQTPATWQKGLMKIKKMESNQGMLFIFPKEKHRIFWMKDTYIALDLIFLNKNLEIIGIVENNQPMSEENIKIDKKSKYILEVNAGFVKKHKIVIGEKLKL